MSSSSSSVLLTPVRKESTLNLTPPPPPNPAAELVHFPSLPNLVDLNNDDEDYSNDANGRPIGFFLLPPPAIGGNVVHDDAAILTRRSDSRKRVAVSPSSSPKLLPRPLKKMKVLNFDKAIR